MFKNFNLSDDEVLQIIDDYKNLIVSNSLINGVLDEDLQQEIKLNIYMALTKNRENF